MACRYWFETVSKYYQVVDCNTFLIRTAQFIEFSSMVVASNVANLDFQVYNSLAVKCVCPSGHTEPFKPDGPFLIRQIQKIRIESFSGFQCSGREAQFLYANSNVDGRGQISHYLADQCPKDENVGLESSLMVLYGNVDVVNSNTTQCRCGSVASTIAFEPTNGKIDYFIGKNNYAPSSVIFFGNYREMETADFDNSYIIENTCNSGNSLVYVSYLALTIGDVNFIRCSPLRFAIYNNAVVNKIGNWKCDTAVSRPGALSQAPDAEISVPSPKIVYPTAFFSSGLDDFHRLSHYAVVFIGAGMTIVVCTMVNVQSIL